MATSAESDMLKAVVEQCVSPVRGSVVALLIAGICGILHPTLLDPAASLLYTILRASGDEAQWFYEAGLQQEQFKLGTAARVSISNFLARCSSGDASSESLMEISEDIWVLHQHSENDSVSESDQVVEFIQKLG